MGLFTTYIGYRLGRKKAAAEIEDMLDDRCENCGHTLSQHSRDGRQLCPTYPN